MNRLEIGQYVTYRHHSKVFGWSHILARVVSIHLSKVGIEYENKLGDKVTRFVNKDFVKPKI